MPTKGISLPLVSSGGSSLLVNLAAIGVLLNISRQTLSEAELRPVSVAQPDTRPEPAIVTQPAYRPHPSRPSHRRTPRRQPSERRPAESLSPGPRSEWSEPWS